MVSLLFLLLWQPYLHRLNGYFVLCLGHLYAFFGFLLYLRCEVTGKIADYALFPFFFCVSALYQDHVILDHFLNRVRQHIISVTVIYMIQMKD